MQAIASKGPAVDPSDPGQAIVGLRGEMTTALAEINGNIRTMNTSIKLGFDRLQREQAALKAAIDKQETDGEEDCAECHAGLVKVLDDHEARIRTREQFSWKREGAYGLVAFALVIVAAFAGPFWERMMK